MDKSIEIQKLRAFAVLMVLFGHMPIQIPDFLLHGYTGVSLFFVISGYVVTRSFTRSEPDAGGKASRQTVRHLRDFYLRRIFRILPVALIWILLYLVTARLIGYFGGSYGTVSRWIHETKWFLTGFYNYFYAASHAPGLFGHYWSLAVEMQFYAVLPFLLILFRTRRRRTALCIVFIVMISTISRMLTPAASIGFLTHTQADSLFAGVLICILAAGPERTDDAIKGHGWDDGISRTVKSAVFLLLTAALFLLPAWMDGRVEPIFKYPVFTLLAAAIVYLAQRNSGWVLGGLPVLDRILVYIADRSYSIYVCHVILYSGVYYNLYIKHVDSLPFWIRSTRYGMVVQTLFLLVVTLGISDLSYRFIELPFMNLGKRLVKSRREKDAVIREGV